jgi:glycosyltransferase involved in cell wall biosynthesis
LDNSEEARKIGEKARETILKNYTWRKNAQETIEVYRDMLQPHPMIN